MEEVTTLFDSDEAENEYMKEREEKEKPSYIDRAHYCKHICKCNKDACDRSTCPIWSAPAVDVISRKNAETEKRLLLMNAQAQLNLMAELAVDFKQKYENARKEVAAEIFAEIEKLKGTKYDWTECVEWDGIAELKKNYTGVPDINVGHKKEEEPDNESKTENDF